MFNIKQPPEAVSRAIYQLSNNANFESVVKWIETLKSEAETQVCVEMDSSALRQIQGKLQILRGILYEVENAKQRLNT